MKKIVLMIMLLLLVTGNGYSKSLSYKPASEDPAELLNRMPNSDVIVLIDNQQLILFFAL